MTGYASATAGGPDGAAGSASGAASSAAVTVELRSVNSRFLDLVLRLPDEVRGLEPALRELVGAGIKRGKVELRLTGERGADATPSAPQAAQLATLAGLQRAVQQV
ncbi:MAG: YicC/YloC family endoribonuclease, partial [Leptothrix sp. (in: b-proteobacteria)]